MINQPDSSQIKELFQNAKRIAVVGLSDNPSRTSYQVSHYMHEAGYEIIPINPTVKEVFGKKAYASLAEAESEGPIDIVNVFRRSEFLPQVAEEAAAAGAKSFWAQLGLYNEKAESYLQEQNVFTVMDRCIMVEHSRLAR
jgi:predicted CoA-binding protein